MADDHPEHAEVEQRAADAQQPVLVELRRAGGPAELVVAVAPEVPDDEDRRGRRRARPPTGTWFIGGLLRGWSCRASAVVSTGSGRGVEPRVDGERRRGRPPPRAGPRRPAGVRRPRSSPSQRRAGSRDSAEHAGATASPRSRSASRSSSSPARWSSSSCQAGGLVDGRGELEHDAEVVGQLGVGRARRRPRGRPA